MYLIYTDEAGNTGMKKDPDQPVHMIGAMLVEDDKVEQLIADFGAIVARRFPDIYLQPDFEVHGSAVFGGTGLFKGVRPAERIGACHDILDLVIASKLPLMWTAINKLTCYASEHPHTLAFRFLVERVEEFLQRKGSLGLVIADETNEMEQSIIDDLVRYKKFDTGFGYRPTQITRIIDSVHFVQSKNNPGVQIIDLVTYFVNKGMRLRDQIVADWRASPDGLSYADFIAANPPRPNLQVVLDLSAKIGSHFVATKRFG